ncbi:hypothetical protein EDD92_5733 [Streptomyces sp. TLI_185]|nr:hypothetical protein EDD92_5733 [Streptomyces sp. TLI_185]
MTDLGWGRPGGNGGNGGNKGSGGGQGSGRSVCTVPEDGGVRRERQRPGGRLKGARLLHSRGAMTRTTRGTV